MKSIKPGRAPSAQAFLGSIFAIVFSIFWTITAVKNGAPIMFLVFGVGFTIMAVVQAVFHFVNTTGKNRFSQMDITEENEETDPWNEHFSKADEAHLDNESQSGHDGARFCPYCGEKAEADFEYCKRCGKKIPD